MPEPGRIQYLLEQYTGNRATEEEISELMLWIESGNDEDLVRQHVLELWNSGDKALTGPGLEWKNFYEKKINPRQTGKRSRIIQRWISIAALLIVVAGTYFTWHTLQHVKTSPSIATQNSKAHNIIGPAKDRAILTRANGSKIILDTAPNGEIAIEEGINVVKDRGELVYKVDHVPETVTYNTLTTPKGGKYRLMLADGTRVWLNAVSSIHFPTAFNESQRRVEVTGEAYFEVTHNPGKPFIVSVKGMEVEVLGTHFNINAYDDEDLTRTTLLQGRVKVNKGLNKVFLSPGQQAVTTSKQQTTDLRVINDVDVDDVMAWKEGYFNFDHSNITRILREFSRWYDIEVQCEPGVGEQHKFFGIVSRNTSLTSALKVLKTGGPPNINYRIEGKKLMVQASNK